MRVGDKRWSLARRITWVFVLTCTAFVLLVSGISVLAVRAAADRELEALATEEADETRVLFSVTPGTQSDLNAITERLTRSHPGNPMAWRVWEKAGGRSWGEFGVLQLLREVPPWGLGSGAENGALLAHGPLRWKVFELTPELELGLLIDGTAQLSVARKFLLVSVGFVLLAIVLSTLAGAFLGRRVSRLLRSVSVRARGVRDISDNVELGDVGLPEEVREVMQALQQMLHNVRGEADQNNKIMSGLAHEVRSPIQNLMGEIEVSLARDRDPREYREVLLRQQHELRRLGRVLDNFVMMSAADEFRRSGIRERFDLGREAEIRLEGEREDAERRDIRLQFDLQGELAYEGDRESILLVLRNLVSNAIDWSSAGEAVHVLLAGEHGALEITVDDSGPGVAADERDKIFEPFYRGSAANGARVGFGLGLALTRKAVEAHGGAVQVLGSPLGGARFKVTLPRAGSELCR